MSSKKEIWKAVLIHGKKPTVPYVVSNHGRFGVMTNGKVDVRPFKATSGHYRYNVRQHGKNKAIFLFREVAIAFLKKPSSKHIFVIHKDHNYLNDHVDNLKWATLKEHRAHTSKSPRSIEARTKKAITRSTHSKVMNEKNVIALKKMIWDPKRKLSLRQIANKFGVSEMQIYRIKSGEFWYHIHVDNEPLHKKYKQNLNNIAFHEKKTAREKAILDSRRRKLSKPKEKAKSARRKKK